MGQLNRHPLRREQPGNPHAEHLEDRPCRIRTEFWHCELGGADSLHGRAHWDRRLFFPAKQVCRGLFRGRQTRRLVGGRAEYLLHDAQRDHLSVNPRKRLRHQLDMVPFQHGDPDHGAGHYFLLPPLLPSAGHYQHLRVPRDAFRLRSAQAGQCEFRYLPARAHGHCDFATGTGVVGSDRLGREILHHRHGRAEYHLHRVGRHRGGHLDGCHPDDRPHRRRVDSVFHHRRRSRWRLLHHLQRGGPAE